MPNILIEIINEGKLDNYLNETEKKELIELTKGIKRNYLYKSEFHGLHHSEKVLLFAYLIGQHDNLSVGEMEIITDVAIYHDIGRHTEEEETIHGYVSAQNLGEVLGAKPIYQKKEVFKLAQALCDAHSVADNRSSIIFDIYELPYEWLEVYQKLLSILKDSDALDRTRFGKTSNFTLKEKFLRTPFSRQLVDLAYHINDYYRDKISEKFFNTHVSKIKTESEIICNHGIGFNFVFLEGILESGILSEYAKKKKNINSNRNFQGNNNDLWISVTVGSGEARELFVDSGISFEAKVPYLEEGITNGSKARSEGLPINSGRYTDERFAFYEIPYENILKININEESLEKDISTLNYFNGSRNYDTLERTIDTYLNYLRTKLKYFPDIEKIEEIKVNYREELLKFESKSIDEQKSTYSQFFASCDAKVSMLNCEIQSMINEAFKRELRKDMVTTYDVINYILLKKRIDYRYQDGQFFINESKIK